MGGARAASRSYLRLGRSDNNARDGVSLSEGVFLCHVLDAKRHACFDGVAKVAPFRLQ